MMTPVALMTGCKECAVFCSRRCAISAGISLTGSWPRRAWVTTPWIIARMACSARRWRADSTSGSWSSSSMRGIFLRGSGLAAGVGVGTVAFLLARGWRRRTGIEPARPRCSASPVLKTGAPTRTRTPPCAHLTRGKKFPGILRTINVFLRFRLRFYLCSYQV